MGCGDLICDKCHLVRDVGHHYLYCYDQDKIMLNKYPFLCFSDEVIAKLYPKWSDYCSLKEFEDICRKSRWNLYWTGLSYNPSIPTTNTISYFGEPIDPNQEYVYEHYELECKFEKIVCTIFYKFDKNLSYGDPAQAIAVCFYDA